MGVGDRLHHLQPVIPYQIQLTLEAGEDLEQALQLYEDDHTADPSGFLTHLTRTVHRIALFPHLARIYPLQPSRAVPARCDIAFQEDVRTTVVAGVPCRIWYLVDEATSTVILLAMVLITHPGPPLTRAAPVWKRKPMPYLPPVLPDPYCGDSTQETPDWDETQDRWWEERMEALKSSQSLIPHMDDHSGFAACPSANSDAAETARQ